MLGFGCRLDGSGCLDDAVTTFSDLIAHYQEQGQPTTNYQKGGQPTHLSKGVSSQCLLFNTRT